MSRTLISIGTMLIILGFLWPLMVSLGLGRLPGDIIIERENLRLYAPITTSMLLSLVASTILWILQRLWSS